MATHSSMLAWRIPMDSGAWWATVHGVSERDITEQLSTAQWQKMKIMASGPITSWEIDGETVSDFIFLGSKITADGDCSHEIKDAYSLGGKL